MDFDTACDYCKPGQYVKSKQGSWTEHDIQYGKDSNGVLYWTAGHTAGGVLDARYRTDAQRKLDYAIYERFGDNTPRLSSPSPAKTAAWHHLRQKPSRPSTHPHGYGWDSMDLIDAFIRGTEWQVQQTQGASTTTQESFQQEELITDRLTELYPTIAKAIKKAQDRYLIYLDAHPKTYSNEDVIKTVNDCVSSVVTAVSDLLPHHDDDQSLSYYYFEQINN